MNNTKLYIGIDLGTGGIRGCVIDEKSNEVTNCRQPWPSNGFSSPEIWWALTQVVINELLAKCDPKSVKALCVDGTSASLFLSNAQGETLSATRMYNDTNSEFAAEIAKAAPTDSAVLSTSSSLSKVLALKSKLQHSDYLVMHQADWITGHLRGQFSSSDANNCLKMGYDNIKHQWPTWLEALGVQKKNLPNVVEPGRNIGSIDPQVATALGLHKDTVIVSGTTDSIAATIASGIQQPGDAVTSLGSTLVIKLISAQPVFSSEHGIYSHRVGDQWLVGGASNTGGAVLKSFFDDQQLHTLSQQIDPEQTTGLDYYPLNQPGERFPVNDPTLAPRLSPRPDNDALFLHGLLQGMAKIEADAYALLASLGATPVQHIISAGGGAVNTAWAKIRAKHLGIVPKPAIHTEASYGSALLARAACTKPNPSNH